jgi:argininosuccinate lyase
MRELAGGFVTASEVANTIVRECGMPFREAHEIVGSAARSAMDRGGQRLDVADIREAARRMIGHDLDIADSELEAAADSGRFIGRLVSPGSANPAHTRELIAGWRDQLDKDRRSIESIAGRIGAADDELVRRARDIATP